MNKKHVYLTGFMGAGKSKIGPLLARRLGWRFLDSDEMIERESGKKIYDIFAEDGETQFRIVESKILRRITAKREPCVIALGGGVQKRAENADLIRESGICIYIKSSPESILERVKHSRKRPLLNIEPGPDFEERLLERISSLLAEREPVYNEADIVFPRDGYELEEIVTRLADQVKQRSGLVNDTD